MTEASKYEQRGVSADKTDVHNAIRNLDKGLFPNAFCKILPDLAGNDPEYVNVMHADTAGTKTSLAYIYWRETGDNSVWKGVVQDSIVMNLDDMACAGITDNIILSSTIGRNKNYISGDVLSHLIAAAGEFIAEMQQHGVSLYLSGGETADVGDIVRTLDVGYTAFARLPKKDVVDIQVRPGSVIVAFASYGKAAWEKEYNGGMGSNGLTSARHDVFSNEYTTKYPESYDAVNMPQELAYSGSLKLTDIESQTGITAGKLVLSPTRTYLPLIKAILAKHRPAIQGMIHCTGGAQTKVMKFVENLRVVKNNLLPVPPLFRMIQEQSGTDAREMYKVFNMGHRLEIYTDAASAQDMIAMAAAVGIDAQVIGYCEAADKNELLIESELGTFTY
ncbi:MAG: phosphoribosylformylglycinamidine cyclo-ligase [Bacteroidia bacterium]|nr:phosphoribosylformylglycinamidine cyclo-ligase [Bacteroidia bacterium]